eukprot:4305051-Prorocentrum_lima.AAC.1
MAKRSAKQDREYAASSAASPTRGSALPRKEAAQSRIPHIDTVNGTRSAKKRQALPKVIWS